MRNHAFLRYTVFNISNRPGFLNINDYEYKTLLENPLSHKTNSVYPKVPCIWLIPLRETPKIHGLSPSACYLEAPLARH